MQPAGHHTRNSDGRRTRDRLPPHSRGLRCAPPGPRGPHPRPPTGHAGHHVRAGPRGRSGNCPWGDRRPSWPLNQFRQEVRVRIATPCPQVRGRTTTTGLFPENLSRDLTRTDRDPAWPLILAQLAGRAPDPLACDAPLAAAVAAQAAAQGLAFIDRAAVADAVTNGTLELVLPGWQWRRRTWMPHQDCSCSSTTFRRGE